MIKTGLKMILPLLLIFLIIGSISANVVNYTEINETVEHNTIIDEKPIINSSQELINVENKTYDEISVKNETVSNITYEEHTQKIIGYNTSYIHIPNGGYKSSEINYVLLENGSNITYDNGKLACSNCKLSNCVNATLHLKNGTVFNIVIHNEKNNAYQKFMYRQDVPIYEDEVTVFENITNKITTFVNHITEVLYQVIDISQPIPSIPINNTTDANTTDVNTIDAKTIDVNITNVNITEVNITDVNNTEIVINNIIDEPNVVVADNNIEIDDVEIGNLVDVVKMENTGGFISVLVLAILLIILAFVVIVLKD